MATNRKTPTTTTKAPTAPAAPAPADVIVRGIDASNIGAPTLEAIVPASLVLVRPVDGQSPQVTWRKLRSATVVKLRRAQFFAELAELADLDVTELAELAEPAELRRAQFFAELAELASLRRAQFFAELAELADLDVADFPADLDDLDEDDLLAVAELAAVVDFPADLDDLDDYALLAVAELAELADLAALDVAANDADYAVTDSAIVAALDDLDDVRIAGNALEMILRSSLPDPDSVGHVGEAKREARVRWAGRDVETTGGRALAMTDSLHKSVAAIIVDGIIVVVGEAGHPTPPRKVARIEVRGQSSDLWVSPVVAAATGGTPGISLGYRAETRSVEVIDLDDLGVIGW